MNTSELKRFFDVLTPKLKDAKAYDDKMDRECAHRFNVLDYVRTDEIGLSKIIADLFNPDATHGQDAFFLRSFLCMLCKEDNCNVDSSWLDLDLRNIEVEPEKEIEIRGKRRKIDIYVTMENESGKYCLAIENKPYADDQPRQLADYLKHLTEKYDKEKFLLIYLPSRGQRPSESSLPMKEYTNWKGRFKIMAYYNEREFNGTESKAIDELAHYGISFSLVDWFSECRNNCKVDRLQSFLRDAKHFCEKKFGGYAMALSREEKVLIEYLFSDSKHSETAYTIYEAWPKYAGEVFKRFQNRLLLLVEESVKDKLKEKRISTKHIEVEFTEGRKSYEKNLSITRSTWKELDVGKKEKHGAVDSRIGCWLEVQNNCIVLGVALPVDKSKIVERECSRVKHLQCRLNSDRNLNALGFKSDSYQSWYLSCKYPKPEFQCWSKLVSFLQKETELHSEINEITEYFVSSCP